MFISHCGVEDLQLINKFVQSTIQDNSSHSIAETSSIDSSDSLHSRKLFVGGISQETTRSLYLSSIIIQEICIPIFQSMVK